MPPTLFASRQGLSLRHWKLTQLLCFGPLLLAFGYLPLTAKPSPEKAYALRGYREFTSHTESLGEGASAVEVNTFTFSQPERAAIFESKLYSDYELTVGNSLAVLTTSRGPVDAISMGGTGYLLPLLEQQGLKVRVLAGRDLKALTAQANRLLQGTPVRRAQLTHPQFMDKWDRYPIGVWNRFQDMLQDPDYKTPETYYPWFGKVGLNPQVSNATYSEDLASNDNFLRMMRHYFAASGVHYQNVEWLQAVPDLYNRNPFLSSFDGPGMMAKFSYYGEVAHAPGLLRDVQHAPVLAGIKDMAQDPGLMAIVDPDGEIGPYKECFWGEYGPLQRRNFVHYLKEVRHMTLREVSRRYYGNSRQLKSWDDVTLADWRTFYGWTDGSLDLAGEWRVMRDDNAAGLREGWQAPAYNDADWIRLSYPGDMTLHSLIDYNNPKPLWMRRTITVDPGHFQRQVYLSLAPLCPDAVAVFVNGKRMEPMDRASHIRFFGQYDVTSLVRDNPSLVVTLRFTGQDLPIGPVFLTSKVLQTFPTDDPLLNARRYDHLDFMDWAVADSVGSMWRRIRSIDPDRPIKVQAYESAWGWKMIQELGGYSHHTGASAGVGYTIPKQYGLARNLEDSAETGGSVETPRNFKGLMGNLAFMGKNAHDYFHDLQDVTKNPGMRQWLADRLPEIRTMGRVNANASPIACIRGLRNYATQGEFNTDAIWRYACHLERGGEMTPLLDEIRIGEGNLPYRAIVDEGTLCWDEAMTAALRAYVEGGGILFLQSTSGLHTPVQRNAVPGPALAGVQITGVQTQPSIRITLTIPDPLFGGTTGDVGTAFKHPKSDIHTIIPLPGTEVIGTTKDGLPAVTRRSIGKGAVYYCAGGGWPQGIQTAIINKLGISVYATVEGQGTDLLRTARSNNGCEDLLMLRGLGKESTVHWTFDYVPSSIYNPTTGKAIPAKIDGKTAAFTVNIPDWDFAWFAARRPDGREQFGHWLQRQSQIWGGLAKSEAVPKPSLFRSLDLNRGWKLAQTDSRQAAERLMPLDDKAGGLSSTDLVSWSAPGMGLKHGKGIVGLYRRDFTLPAGWEKNTTLELTVAAQGGAAIVPGFSGSSAIYINGSRIWEGAKIDHASLDATASIKAGTNRLEIIHEGEGITAAISLLRTVNPDATIDLAGAWQAVDGLNAVRTVQLPGKVETSFVFREIIVPREQAGKEVWLRVESENSQYVESARFVIVNGRNRYSITRSDISQPLEINITPEIRFGAPNRLLIGGPAMDAGWKKTGHDYRKLKLCFYTPGRWSADGKGIREALTPRELESVRRVGERVTLYPLVQTAVAKQPVNPFHFSEEEARAYTPPQPLLDLDLSATNGTVTDRSPNRIPVKMNGNCTHFSERGGTVTGIQLHAEDANHGCLSLPKEPFQKFLTGKSFTMCAWIKPLLNQNVGGSLVRWHHILGWDVTDDGSSFFINQNFSQKILAHAVLTQRHWHFMTVSMAANQATLYVDGLDVGSQTFDAPLMAGGVPFDIGSAFGNSGFLNMKLARFAIYQGALNGDEVAKLYLQDHARFAGEAGRIWPEDYFCLLAITPNGVTDHAELPCELTCGPGTKPVAAEGLPVLDFDGKTSSFVVKENPRVHLLGKPFSMIADINPAVGTAGCIFRRYHNLGLWLRKDGSIMFDANIGRQNQVTFPKAVTHGQWNRLMLTYDGQTVALFLNGKLIERKPYSGSLSINRAFPLSVGADNTYGKGTFGSRMEMKLREFSIFPKVLDSMP